MNVLIVESQPDLGLIWSRHLERQGASVELATGQDLAISLLRRQDFDVIIMDLLLDQGSALAVADFASYRQPDTKVIFVSHTSFFSDGSIFQHCSNACAFVQRGTRPEDLAAMVEHYSAPVRRADAVS